MILLLIYAAGWLGLVALAILNGVIREKCYTSRLGELPAHQVSTVIGLVLFGAYAWLFSGLFPMASARQAVAIGAMWLSMTIAFEFVFGHYVMGHSWEKLLHDYHLLRGRIWVLVLIWTAVAPYVCFRIRA